MTKAFEKTINSSSLQIPKQGQIDLNKEIDLTIQKTVLKKITRLSPASAQVEFELNTGEDKNIKIRSFEFYSPDMKK